MGQARQPDTISTFEVRLVAMVVTPSRSLQLAPDAAKSKKLAGTVVHGTVAL